MDHITSYRTCARGGHHLEAIEPATRSKARGHEETMEPNDPPHMCAVLAWALPDPNSNIEYRPRWREYHVLTTALPPDHPDFIPRKLGDERIALPFCPFDGTPLPPSLRDQWNAKVLALGLDPNSVDLADLREELRDARWWFLPTQG